MKKGKLQVKDITDFEIYEAIKICKSREKYTSIYTYLGYPDNLLTAKLMKMVDEKKIDYGVSIAYPFII